MHEISATNLLHYKTYMTSAYLTKKLVSTFAEIKKWLIHKDLDWIHKISGTNPHNYYVQQDKYPDTTPQTD